MAAAAQVGESVSAVPPTAHRPQATARIGIAPRSVRCLWAVGCVGFLLSPLASAATFALIVSGLGGEARYDQRFNDQAATIATAAGKLTGDSARVTSLSGAKATRESIRAALRTLASKVQKQDRVMVVLIGHGSFDGEEYRFNVAGPDITANELAGLLNQISAGEQLIVNATSASGAVADRWQRNGRVIVTATKSGGERTATRFAQYWLEAVSSDAADLNKDDIVTAKEAFEYASRKVGESFKTDVSLATEHARLEGRGAERFQVARLGAAALAGTDPALTALLEQRVTIERDIEAVKERKATSSLDAWYDELEVVLVKLALLQKQIDARQTQVNGATTSMTGDAHAP